jgi:P2-related tail formation protein
MSAVGQVLPDTPEVFEEAVAAALSADLPVPFAVLMDPAETRPDMLPWLAAHESVDLWYSDWSEERKRLMIADAPALAKLVGTRAAAERFLDYVDAVIIHKVSYPAPFVIGKTHLGDRVTIHQDHHKAYYLILISPRVEPDHFVIGQSRVDQVIRVRDVDYEPMRRVKAALRAAKAPDTEYAVDFGWKRKVTFADAWPLGTPRPLDLYIERTRL